MTDTNSFTKLVPGFDFLQGLVKNAGVALPGMGQWVAPTLDPEELNKRIEELRTVQFWLEQNARMLAATIQALEVQKMTLSTLKTMNVQMGDLRDSLKASWPDKSATAPSGDAKGTASKPFESTASAGVPAVDPMQWWGALTKQFTELATSALQESQGMAAVMGRRSFDGVDAPATPTPQGTVDGDSGASQPARKSSSSARKRPGTPAQASDKGAGG